MARWLLLSLITFHGSTVVAADTPKKATPEQIEFFEKKVRPILADHCYGCHGPKKQNGGLRLDTSAGLKAGADDGPVIVPGDTAKSRLLKSVRHEGDFKMPPKMAIPPKAVATLTEWVKAGAITPEDAASGNISTDPRKHWAFQPVKVVVPPEVRNPKLEVRNDIDRFILAKIEPTGLSPAPLADRRTLIRRAYLDLIGLPPSAAEVEAFEKDASPNAWSAVIDRLLASPQYGQRWGRYWLDLARYADTKGYVFNEDRNYPFAYTYRDYVIRSLNEDKPYDQFVTEQLAADLLPLGDDKRPLAALGFLTLGRRFLSNTHDIIDDRIDVVTRGLMGLSVGCARCHDHKFDPIPTADYYSLYGIFASTTEPKELPLIAAVQRTPEVIAFEKEVEKREGEYKAELQKRHAATIKKLRDPAVVADYIRAVIEARKVPEAQLQAYLRERDLSPHVFGRWRAFLSGQFKQWSPVYGPISVLADLPEKEFAEKAPELIVALGINPKMAGNPLVVKALSDAKPKTFKAAVAAVASAITAIPTAEPTEDQAELAKVWAVGGPLDIPVTDFDKIQNRADRDALTAIQKKTDAFKAANPFAPPRAHVLNDKPSPFQSYVFLRGNPGNRGPVVPRQSPAIATPNRKAFSEGSGRLELAKAVVSPENPLTARVLVNRVWVGHFGHGLVRTPSDFGVRTDAPSHPELLDWLAIQFVKEGWSLKKIHKLIMTSATYQRSSLISAEAFKLDTDNKLLTHQNRRRLDFEAMRDSFLAVSGKLDLTAEGKPVDLFKAPFSSRRSIYGLIDRTNFPGTMRAFDVASPDTHSPQRFQTTAPQQALFLMNSPFVTEQARSLASRSEVVNAKTPTEKVTALYRLALSRNPMKGELDLALEFVAEDDPKALFGVWPQLAQALLLCNELMFID
ncbi:MAG: hypothetical protein C0467_05625 [Planctomycetaceae bacterium]|nr:hypothetical protein [Planctomycetaceae bacterium]